MKSLFYFQGLATSDWLFCTTMIPFIFLTKDSKVYKERSISLFFTLYGPYFQNLFIKSSGWITVSMSVYRHLCVHYPIWSKQTLSSHYTMCSVGFCAIFWILFLLPLLWTWDVQDLQCSSTETFLLRTLGTFELNTALRKGTTFQHF